MTEMRSQTELRQVKFKENTYKIDLEKVPALKEAAFAGNINNYATAIQFEMNYMDFPGSPIKTYATTWEDISKSIYKVDLFGAELERGNYFEKDIDVLLGMDIAGKLYFSPLMFMATEANPLKAETRVYLIDFGFPIKDRYIVNNTLPEGYTVESLPEGVVYNLGDNTGSYRYLISHTGDKLQLSVELSINRSFIVAEEYGSLKKFFELCVAKEKEKVVLSKA